MSYQQLSHTQIPKVQKTAKLSVFLRFWDLRAQKVLVECWWNCQFHQCSMYSFCARRSQKRKKYSQVISVFLRFWNLRAQKLLVECWWNWPQVSYMWNRMVLYSPSPMGWFKKLFIEHAFHIYFIYESLLFY